MKKFNLKVAKSQDFTTGEKQLEEQRKEQETSADKQGTATKNINLSLPVKDPNNLVPFNAQLAKARKDERGVQITEAHMDKKEFQVGDKSKQVMDINEETQKYDSEKEEAYKKASDKDTLFWDKYVGIQKEGPKTKVKGNLPESASQLQNQPARFKGKEIDKMVLAQLKDADAMLFHIFSTAKQESRELTENEQQQVTDIEAGKAAVLAQMVEPVRRSLEYGGDPTIKKERDGSAVVIESDGVAIDRFKSCEEAKANYPEGDIEDE